jgi:hypothetical protein
MNMIDTKCRMILVCRIRESVSQPLFLIVTKP